MRDEREGRKVALSETGGEESAQEVRLALNPLIPHPSSLIPVLFAPWRERCGISDYTRHLVTALRELPEVADARIVEAPATAARGGTGSALRHFAADARRFRALGEQMNAESANVAHIQHQYFFFGGVAPHKSHVRAFLNAVRIPIVMTVHEIALPGEGASLMQRKALALANRLNFLHPAIRRFIVHTEEDRERLRVVGVLPERIHIIPVGVPPAEPMPAREEAQRVLNVGGRRVVTLFGFLSVKKGHRLALDALEFLPPDVLLLFAGERHPDDFTDYVPELQAEIEARGLSERVRITGYLAEERLPAVMAATDTAIAPFPQSSGSASLAHLLAYTRPIVASDIPPHQQMVHDTPGCLSLFRSGDASDLAEKILAVLNDDEQCAALQVAAHAYSVRHSYTHMARETVEVYRLAVSEA